MDSASRQADFRKYCKDLDRKRLPFNCPRCGIAVLPKQFEKHCFETHDFNTRCRCVWCWGEKSWPPRKKNANSVHLLECFRKFIDPYETSAALETVVPSTTRITSSPTIVPYKNRLLCPGRCFFNHDSDYILNNLPPEALDTFSLLEVDDTPPLVPYQNENINLATSYVLKYEKTQDTHDWFHIMVKAVAFESFLNALDDGCRLLAFSCWCDGGEYEDARHRQHRHMVISSTPKGHFESNVWPRVRIAERPCPNYRSKLYKEIDGHMHLVNTIGYMSKRTSRCEFTFTKNNKKLLKENHFYILTTLPEQYRLPLVVSWKEGLLKLMHQDLFKNVSLERVLQQRLPNRVKGQWKQKIDDFYKLPRDLVLAVGRDYVPTRSRITPHYIHLLEQERLYFERRPGLAPTEWLARQVEGGNSFYGNVGRRWWTPRPADQKTLTLVMRREDRIRMLKNENARLIQENRQLNNKIHDIYEQEIKRLNRKVEELEKRLDANIYANGNNNIDHLIINNHY